MKNVKTITGEIGIIDRMPSSRNGNPRFRVSISEPGDPEPVLAVTMPDAQAGYHVQNFRPGDRVRAEIGEHYNRTTISHIEHDTQ